MLKRLKHSLIHAELGFLRNRYSSWKKLRSGNESQKGGISLRDSGDSCVTSYHWPTEKKKEFKTKRYRQRKIRDIWSLSIYISGHTASIHTGAGEGKNDGKCKINRRITRDDVWWEMEKRKKKKKVNLRSIFVRKVVYSRSRRARCAIATLL